MSLGFTHRIGETSLSTHHIGRGHIMDDVYIDRDGYEVQHPHRPTMCQEGEQHGYGSAPLQYVDNQPIVGSGPPLLPLSGSTHQAHHMASTRPMPALAHGKECQPPSTSMLLRTSTASSHSIRSPPQRIAYPLRRILHDQHCRPKRGAAVCNLAMRGKSLIGSHEDNICFGLNAIAKADQLNLAKLVPGSWRS